MKKLLNNKTFRLAIIILLLLTAGISAVLYYRSQRTKLLDKEAFNAFKSGLNEYASSEEGGFSSQQDLSDFITQWADSNSLDYTVDASGNIIFEKPAVSRKKNVSPTLIAVSMNYETAGSDSGILAAAASIALSDIESGRVTVIFFNNEDDLATGYKRLDDKYITKKTKVIFLDRGTSTYLSTSSFQERSSDIIIPAGRSANQFDTAVKVSITGIGTRSISTGISKQPDPFSMLSSMLTWLKSKSVVYGISDISVGSRGKMYPVSLDVTFCMNSYNVSSFTTNLDKKIKEWEKSFSEDHPDFVCEYEVISEDEYLPAEAYDAATCDKLTCILYTIQNGTYKYKSGDAIPDGMEEGDVYGINCLTALSPGNDSIRVSLITQGVNDLFVERIMNDNKVAVQLYECSMEQTDRTEAFLNEKDSLARTFTNTYKDVNENAASDSTIKAKPDKCFTPCSYLAEKNRKADIIHIRVKSSLSSRMANTILCYIKAKGNSSIFK